MERKRHGLSFFVVRFCLLPEVPMVPRLWDRRAGYFTTDLQIGGPSQLTTTGECTAVCAANMAYPRT